MNPRLAAIRPSPIRLLSEGAPADAIPLGLGEPTWDLPDPAREALASWAGPCGYGPNAGLPELRGAIADWHGAKVEETLVTCGSAEALYAAAQAHLQEGDQALVPDPGFPAYPAVVRLAGAEPVPYALVGRDLDADRFISAVDAAPRVRMAFLNHPSNPTGGGASRETLARVAEACAARGVVLLSDEVYRELHFGTRPLSLRDVTDGGLVTTSVSKGWGAPGLRVGWAVGPESLLAPIRTVHAFAVSVAPAPSQRAAAALLRHSHTVLAQARGEVATRFQALREAWREGFGEELEAPSGGFYHWMRLPGSAHADPMAFCMKLRDEAKVVLVPGLAFGEAGRPFARLSFAARPEQIREGVARLSRILGGPNAR